MFANFPCQTVPVVTENYLSTLPLITDTVAGMLAEVNKPASQTSLLVTTLMAGDCFWHVYTCEAVQVGKLRW